MLVRVLNLKDRLTRLMYMARQKNNDREAELNLVQEKIKRLKIDIGTKINAVKLDLEKKTKEKKNTNKPSQTNFKIVLSEFKEVTELL